MFHRPIVGWLLAVGTWWMSRRLTIPTDRAGRAFTAAFGLVAAFVAFSPSFGADWLLGARLQVFVPPLAAVANAVSEAAGVRLTDLPMSPPRVLKAVQES